MSQGWAGRSRAHGAANPLAWSARAEANHQKPRCDDAAQKVENTGEQRLPDTIKEARPEGREKRGFGKINNMLVLYCLIDNL